MTDEAAKDYDETQLIPDPTWAERLVTWFKLLLGLKKTIMVLMGIGVVGVGGNIAEVNPWKEAAIEVGLLSIEPESNVDSAEHSHELQEHTHPEMQAGVAGIAGIAGPPGPAGKDGKDGKDGQFNQADLAAELEKLLPPNHKSLH